MTSTSAPAVSSIPALCQALAEQPLAQDQAEAIDLIQELERAKAALEAAQARQTAVLEQLRIAEEADRGVSPKRRGKGLGAEIALARRESPTRGSQHLNLARALTTDLPHTLRALEAGRIREEHALAVERETAWLSPEHRREVDVMLVDLFDTYGPRKLAGEARAHAQRLDPASAVERLARAESERRVSVRPLPEGMASLQALLPMAQAVGVYAALRRDASTMVGTGETSDPADPNDTPRTRDQIMADLLVERVTGQQTAVAVPAEVQLVMSDAALLGDDDTPARLIGHGPLPAAMVKKWLAHPETSVFLRRVFTRPRTNQLVNLESRARAFPAGLRRMILLRDDVCRTPFCEAPVQDADHMRRVRDGGSTSHDNGSGLCAGCNQTKENKGWEHRGNAEFLRVRTPTGHYYTVGVPPLLPGQDVPIRPPPDPKHKSHPPYTE